MIKGLLVLIASPSGGGKTSVIQQLLNHHRDVDYKYSISATTRKPRLGDIDGKDYFFLTEDEFKEKINNNEFIEWEQVHQYYYGTPKKQIKNWINQNKIVLLDVDVNGGEQIKKKFSENAISVFIKPPSLNVLISRLKKRKTDSEEDIQKRLERVPMEMEKMNLFDYVIINDDLKDTTKQLIKIIFNNINSGGCC